MWGPALIFVFTVIGGVMLAAIAAFSFYKGRKRLAARLVVVLGGAVAMYLVAVVGVALSSEPEVIAIGGEKRICELDCHVAYAIEGVSQEQTLGNTKAEGVFHVVTLRVRFDAETTSESRPEGSKLVPGARRVQVVDAAGRRFDVSDAGQRALGGPPAGSKMLTRELKPGDEFRVQIAFDLPKDVRQPMLLIEDADFTKWVLIGSENFPLHRKALLQLGASS